MNKIRLLVLSLLFGVAATSAAVAQSLPSGWKAQDVGAVGSTGTSTSSSGLYTVTGSGADVWGSADEFQFSYTTLTGDGSIVARVASVQAVDSWTKAGVMVRESLNANSRHAYMLVSPGKGTAFQRRKSTGGTSANTSSSGTAAVWVKVVRSGSTLSGFKSADGASWTFVGSDTMTLPATVYVGLGVTSHADPALAKATFDHVSVTPTVTTAASSGTNLRVMHWNTHHGGVGTDGVLDIPRVVKWIASQRPDLVSLNEIEKYTGWGNQDQPAIYKSLLEQLTGQTWYMVWAQEYGNWTANGKGNLIFSRFPWTVSARYLLPYTRTVALGQVTVNGRNVTLISTHLDPDYESRRLTQAQALVPWATNFAENRIVVGDLNAQPTSTTLTYLKNTYTDGWLTAKSGGFAYSAADNPYGYTRNSRIDYVLTSKYAANLRMVRFEVVDTRDAKGVMPSDHRPIVVDYTVN